MGERNFIPIPWIESQPTPRFDVEVDVDMENSIDDHVYLWGAVLSGRDGSESAREYVPFVDWETRSATQEMALFEQFWEWFNGLRQATQSEGRTFGAYCWNANAENRRLRDLSDHNDKLKNQVEEFISSGAWVDLADSFKNYYTTGTGWGLKKVAPCAGFRWRASDADGEISMGYNEEQLAQSNTQAARLWLLEYNKDDCLATLNVRHWLSSLAPPVKVSA